MRLSLLVKYHRPDTSTTSLGNPSWFLTFYECGFNAFPGNESFQWFRTFFIFLEPKHMYQANHLYSPNKWFCFLIFILLNLSRFTYEIAPVFVLMEQITLKKMREIIGWSSKDGDGIFSPGRFPFLSLVILNVCCMGLWNSWEH
jgi:hypothetical protein